MKKEREEYNIFINVVREKINLIYRKISYWLEGKDNGWTSSKSFLRKKTKIIIFCAIHLPFTKKREWPSINQISRSRWPAIIMSMSAVPFRFKSKRHA